MNTIEYRKPHPSDMAFIYDTWLKSYKTAAYRYCAWTEYANKQLAVINGLIDRGAKILMAHNPESPDHIFGYIVYEVLNQVPVLHWLYVKQPFRRRGVATELLDKAGMSLDGLILTHCTYIVSRWARKGYRITLRPQLLP